MVHVIKKKWDEYWERRYKQNLKFESEGLKNEIADINVNDKEYKRWVIRMIKSNDVIPESLRTRMLKTAMAIEPDSFKWKKSWDKGKIFSKKKVV